MTNRTRTRLAELLRKSVGLPGRDGSCCSTLDRDAGDPEPAATSREPGGCCGAARAADAGRARDRSSGDGGEVKQ